MTSVSESMLPAFDSCAFGPASTSATLLDGFIVSLHAPSASAIAKANEARVAACPAPILPFIIRRLRRIRAGPNQGHSAAQQTPSADAGINQPTGARPAPAWP